MLAGAVPEEDGAAEEPGQVLELERFLPYRMNVLSRRISRSLAEIYQERFGISIPEWRIIAVLGRFAPVSSREICDRTQMDKAKVSRSVSSLLAAGLITRQTNPADNRLIKLALSKRGRRVYQRIVPLALGWEADLLGALGEDERQLLERLLGKLEAKFGAGPVEDTDD